VGHYPWFVTRNYLEELLPKYDDLGPKLLRAAVIGFASSAVSDTCSNSIRVIKTTKQTHADNLSYPQTLQVRTISAACFLHLAASRIFISTCLQPEHTPLLLLHISHLVLKAAVASAETLSNTNAFQSFVAFSLPCSSGSQHKWNALFHVQIAQRVLMSAARPLSKPRCCQDCTVQLTTFCALCLLSTRATAESQP
jgi:hypothetical protein